MNDIDTSKYKVDKPYPKVEIHKKSGHDASLIFYDYAGTGSEYTAVAQYIFAHASAKNNIIANDFLGIAIVEMSHLDMLADVIIDLGYKPKFVNGKNKVWCSHVVPYGNSTKNRIELAIKSEYDAIDQYKNHIKKLYNDDIKKLLARIIIDEELHICIFKNLLKQY